MLSGCAGLPAPENEDDSLIIGSLVLDFPDGFFDWPGRKIDREVMVTVHNVTRNKNFTLMTSRGYFHFLGNGSDEYVLKNCKYRTREGGASYTLGERALGLKIVTTPGKVLYVGHIVLTYKKPGGPGRKDLGARSMFRGDYKIPADRQGNRAVLRLFMDATSWDYQVSVDRSWDRVGLRQFLKERGADSLWLAREIVEYAQ